MTSKEQKGLGLAVGALVLFGAMMVWVLTDTRPSQGTSSEPTAEPEAPVVAAPASTSAPSSNKPAAQPAAAPEPSPTPSVDLFEEGELPPFMAKARARIAQKQWLDVGDQKELYNYGKAHPKDARPQLLLAWDSMNREWDGIGVRMYAIAYHADKRAKDDPSMLRDLLEVASKYDNVENKEATDIIKEAYGAAALEQLDQRLADIRSNGELGRAARLQRLRNVLVPH